MRGDDLQQAECSVTVAEQRVRRKTIRALDPQDADAVFVELRRSSTTGMRGWVGHRSHPEKLLGRCC